jgi:hypothetical protein
MRDPLSRAYRYRKVAAEFFNLAKINSSDFSRAYYQRIAERYQLLADGELVDHYISEQSGLVKRRASREGRRVDRTKVLSAGSCDAAGGSHSSARCDSGLDTSAQIYVARRVKAGAGDRISKIAASHALDRRDQPFTGSVPYPTGGQSTDQERPTDRAIISDEWIRLRSAAARAAFFW